jgi:hypothetical protein
VLLVLDAEVEDEPIHPRIAGTLAVESAIQTLLTNE